MRSYDKIITLSSSPRGDDGLFRDFEDGMYLGGHIRMEAAAELAAGDTDIEMILAGGYNKTGDVFSSDKVNGMADFITERAPDACLTMVESLPCTHHNCVASFNTIRHRDELINRNVGSLAIGLLTNSYHLPRATEFANRTLYRMDMHHNTTIVPISAEDLLGRSITDIVDGNEQQYHKRVEAEERGLHQLRSGTYEDGCLTRNFDSLRQVIGRYANILLTLDEKNSLSEKGNQ